MSLMKRYQIGSDPAARRAAYACVLALSFMGAPAHGQTQTPSAPQDKQTDAARSPACDHPALAEADRLSCAQAWGAATTDQDRAAITERYTAMAKGNTTEGDGVPTAAPSSERAALPATPSGAEGEMSAADNGWLLAVGGGTVILGLAIAFGVSRTRTRKTVAEQAAQNRGTNAAYGRTPPRI